MNGPTRRGPTTTWSAAARLPVVALLVVALAGCGGASASSHGAPPAVAPTSPIGDGETATLADGTIALVGSNTGGSSTTGRVRGRLVAFTDGCLLLDDGASSGALQLLVLEHGTTATADGAGLITPDGVVVRNGDGISGAGRYVTTTESGARQAWPSAPDLCFGVEQVARVTDDLQVDPSVIAERLAAFGHRQEYDDGTLLLVPAEPPDSGMEALTGGVLTRLEGGCLGLSSSDGHRQLVKWPFGSSWDPQQQVLTLPEQGQVRLGQEVSIGGGQGLAAWVEPALPAGCVYDDFWTAS